MVGLFVVGLFCFARGYGIVVVRHSKEGERKRKRERRDEEEEEEEERAPQQW